MLTNSELQLLEALVERARRAEGHNHTEATETIVPGDVVQIRPGADRTWESSLLIVGHVDGYKVRGPILTFHRGGCREAWGRYSRAELVRIGRLPYPEPAPDIKAWCYCPPCPLAVRKPPASEGLPAASVRETGAIYRGHRIAIEFERQKEIVAVAEESAKKKERSKGR